MDFIQRAPPNVVQALMGRDNLPLDAYLAPSWVMGVWIAATITIFVGIFIAHAPLPTIRPSKEDLKIRVGAGLISVGSIGFLICLLIALIYVGGALIPTLWPWVLVLYNSPYVAIPTLLISAGLYGLRRVRVDIYGGLEIVGAIATICIVAFTKYGSDVQRGAALLGSIYFLIRGLDNADRGGLLARLMQRKLESALLILSILTLPGVALLTTLVPSADGPIRPPLMANADGSELPVSAVLCGQIFIVCDPPAWREHFRLVHGSMADRAKAEADAETRLNRMHAGRK